MVNTWSTLSGNRLGTGDGTDAHSVLHAQTYKAQENVRRWGAKGDGTTDDTAAISSAITAWLSAQAAGYPGVLLFPPGNYLVSSQTTITPPANLIGGAILGYGARITMTGGANYAFDINTNAGTHLWRNLVVAGLTTQTCGIRFTGGTSSKALYGLVCRDLNLTEGFPAHGIYMDGPFEASIENCHLDAGAANTTGDCIRITNDTAGAVVSSFEIRGGSTRHGYRGVFANASDCKIFGGTYLQAQIWGVSVASDWGVYSGLHLENNYESAADLASGDAGLSVNGRGTIIGCHGTTNSKQKYVVHTYAGNAITVIGGIQTGSVSKYAYLDGAANSTNVLIGVNNYDLASGWLTTRTGKLLILGSDVTTDLPLTLQGGKATFKAGIGVGNSAAATGPVGNVVKKVELFDETGASLGYLPVYDGIT